MDHQVLGLIALVRAALTGEAQKLPADFDLEQAYDAINKHNIAVMALEGAAICGIDKKLPVMQKLFVQAFAAIARVEEQDRSAAELFDAFEQAQIDFMPVKGALLRGLYPKREYRSMGDMDVLIRVEQYDRIRRVMEELGFSRKMETDHEIIWKKNNSLVELHKHLISSCNDEDYYQYYNSGWWLAQKTDTSRNLMRNENHFLFVFTHFAKHYRGGGVGIRQMCDLWLMRKMQPDMDEGFIRGELTKLRLLEFYDNIMMTLAFWFAGKDQNEIVEYISQMIYESGVFGSASKHTLALGARLSAGKKQNVGSFISGLIRRVFLPAAKMKNRYLILKKMPFLLPVMWICRAVSLPFTRPGELRKVQRSLQPRINKEVKYYQRSLKYVGLEFQMEEKKGF